jgi:hypothetical protein
MLWIRIGFNADPDPEFYVNADLLAVSEYRNLITKNSTLLQLQNISYFLTKKLQYTAFISRPP